MRIASARGGGGVSGPALGTQPPREPTRHGRRRRPDRGASRTIIKILLSLRRPRIHIWKFFLIFFIIYFSDVLNFLLV